MYLHRYQGYGYDLVTTQGGEQTNLSSISIFIGICIFLDLYLYFPSALGMIQSQRGEDTAESEAMLGEDMLTYQNLNITGHTDTTTNTNTNTNTHTNTLFFFWVRFLASIFLLATGKAFRAEKCVQYGLQYNSNTSLHCTMGKLQWEFGSRIFSFLREKFIWNIWTRIK